MHSWVLIDSDCWKCRQKTCIHIIILNILSADWPGKIKKIEPVIYSFFFYFLSVDSANAFDGNLALYFKSYFWVISFKVH